MDLLALGFLEDREARNERQWQEERRRDQEQTLPSKPGAVPLAPMYAPTPIYGSSPYGQPYTYAPPPGYMPPIYPFPPANMALATDPSTPGSSQAIRSRTFSTLPDAEPVRPSSPVEGSNIDDYIQWHLRKKNANREGLLHAAKVLSDGRYDLQTVQSKQRGHEWMKELGIKEGIAIQLNRDVTAFNKSQGQGTILSNSPLTASRVLPMLRSRAASLVTQYADESTIDTQPMSQEGAEEYPHSDSESTNDGDSNDLDRPVSVPFFAADTTATQVRRILRADMPSTQELNMHESA
jgi:hypothetical protein